MQALELKVPPPIAGVLVGLAMWWTAHRMPAVHPAGQWRAILAAACAAFGLTVALLGVWAFRHAKTTVNPVHPEAASSVVTRGIFGYTRNPMYVGLTAELLGWALALGSVGIPGPYRARALPLALSNHSRGARHELEIWPGLRRVLQARSPLALSVRKPFVVNGLTGLWTDGSRTRKGLLKTETSGYAVIQAQSM